VSTDTGPGARRLTDYGSDALVSRYGLLVVTFSPLE
jgi:hypothetical protein